MIRAELTLKKSGLYMVYKNANLEERRNFGESDKRKFEKWIDSYRHGLQSLNKSKLPALLLQLGQEIFNWLNGSESWLNRIIDKSFETPFILEFQVESKTIADGNLFLEVPWELLADNKQHLAADSNTLFCPVRRIGERKEPEKASLYRLNTIFMAAEPRGGDIHLRYEEEESAILEAAGSIGMDLTVEESGSPGLLYECLAREIDIDVVHISCHGSKKEEEPILLLETEEGDTYPTTAERLSSVLGEHKPRLLFLSACMTSEPDSLVNSFSASMVRTGVPAVLGWGGSVRDWEATQFAASIYRHLSLRESLEAAVVRARYDLLAGDKDKTETKPSSPSRDWHLARLYLGSKGGGQFTEGREARRRRSDEAGHKELLDAKKGRIPVAGRREFVGRRRQIQAILREFATPHHAGALIHGFGRQGKSSLAARIANRLGDYRPVVIYENYDALSILEAIRYSIGSEEVEEISSREWDNVKGNPSHLFFVLKKILEGPCCEQPFLLIIDDFEQALSDPVSGDLHRLHPDLIESIRAVLEAFKGVVDKSRCRLLLTSRYRFTLPHRGHDLASGLLEIHLPPMKSYDGQKQAAAKERHLGISIEDEQYRLVNECIKASRGNPGMQDLLFTLCLEAPEKCKDALDAIDKFYQSGEEPGQEEIQEFIRNLALSHLLELLSHGERELLRMSILFNVPVPLPVLFGAADSLGLLGKEGTQPPIERLIAFGLWNSFPDMVDVKTTAVLIHEFARPVAGNLTDEESQQLAMLVVKDMFESWRSDDGSRRPYILDIELGRIAVIARDVVVLEKVAANAIRGLEKYFNYKGAARLAIDTLQILDSARADVPIRFLRVASEVFELTGNVKAAQRCIERALEILSSKDKGVDYGYSLIIYGQLLMKKGEIDRALSQFKEAKGILSSKSRSREHSIVLVHIAEINKLMGKVDEALKIYNEMIQVFEELGDRRSKAVTLGEIAKILSLRGNLDEAFKLHNERLQVFEDLGDQRERAMTLGDIARIQVDQGYVDEAFKLHNEELKVYEELGDQRSRAVTLGEIARILSLRGNLDEALKLHNERLQVFEEIEDQHSRAMTLGDIARIQVDKGQVDEALKLHYKELKVYERLEDNRSKVGTWGDIARIQVLRGEVDEALKLFNEMIKVFEELDDRRSRAVILGDIAKIELAKGNVDEALKFHNERLQVFEELGDRRERAVTLGDIARIQVLKDKDNVYEALKLLNERLQVFEELGDRRSSAITLGDIARIQVSMGKVDEALKLFNEVIKVLEELGDRRERAVTLGDIARIQVSRGDMDEALKLHKERLHVFEELGDIYGKADTLWDLYQIEWQQESYKKALEHLKESYAIYIKLKKLDRISFTGIELGKILCQTDQKDEGIKILEQSRDAFIKLGQSALAAEVQQLIDNFSIEK